jgi:deoxycytidine triphosphate deaminase
MSKKEMEKELLKQYQCLEKDPLKTVGVLLSNEIEYYAANYKLIDPFNRSNLKPAAYELTVGDEYSIGGESHKLFDELGKNEIRISPFEVAVIKTGEKVNLPRFLIARWNIRVKWAYEGLLWVGGPQVDAGYVGHLFCPIYNLSNKEVTLKLGEPVAVIDFVKTTPFIKNKCEEYSRPPKRIVFGDYNPENLKSALYVEARRRIDDIEKKVNSIGTRLDTSIGIIFAAIAVLVATLSILVSFSKALEMAPPVWLYVSVSFSIVSLVVSVFTHAKTRIKKYSIPAVHLDERIGKIERRIKVITVAVILVAIVAVCALIIYLRINNLLPF